MVARVTPADVKIINCSELDPTTITVFINVANSLINTALAAGCGVTDTVILKQAEAFLAAHLIEVSPVSNDDASRTKLKERFENYSVEFAGAKNNGQNVLSTGNGQTANSLMAGCLESIGKPNASIEFF